MLHGSYERCQKIMDSGALKIIMENLEGDPAIISLVLKNLKKIIEKFKNIYCENQQHIILRQL